MDPLYIGDEVLYEYAIGYPLYASDRNAPPCSEGWKVETITAVALPLVRSTLLYLMLVYCPLWQYG
jgi:hypothetical protein